MTSLQAYSDVLATLHAAPLDHEHWQQIPVQFCAFTESLYGIFTGKSLFGKTSTRRQGELIQLLSSLPKTAPGAIAAAG